MMKILKKIRPYKVDSLLSGLDRNSFQEFHDIHPLEQPGFLMKKNLPLRSLKAES